MVLLHILLHYVAQPVNWILATSVSEVVRMAGTRSGDEAGAQLDGMGIRKPGRLLVIITFSSEGCVTEIIPTTINRQSLTVPGVDGGSGP